MTAQLQSQPTPVLFLPDELGPELVPPGTEYDQAGDFTLPVFTGRRYVWVGVGDEGCLNDGNAESSNDPFHAETNELVLTGEAETLVLASVREVRR